MNAVERNAILELMSNNLTDEQFFDLVGHDFISTPSKSTSYIKEAMREKNGDDLELAMFVGFRFGFDSNIAEMLCELLYETWHTRHEDVVSILQNIVPSSSTVITALMHTAMTKYPHIKMDIDRQALVEKCCWAMGDACSAHAVEALDQLRNSEDPMISKAAQAQYDRIISNKQSNIERIFKSIFRKK